MTVIKVRDLLTHAERVALHEGKEVDLGDRLERHAAENGGATLHLPHRAKLKFKKPDGAEIVTEPPPIQRGTAHLPPHEQALRQQFLEYATTPRVQGGLGFGRNHLVLDTDEDDSREALEFRPRFAKRYEYRNKAVERAWQKWREGK